MHSTTGCSSFNFFQSISIIAKSSYIYKKKIKINLSISQYWLECDMYKYIQSNIQFFTVKWICHSQVFAHKEPKDNMSGYRIHKVW